MTIKKSSPKKTTPTRGRIRAHGICLGVKTQRHLTHSISERFSKSTQPTSSQEPGRPHQHTHRIDLLGVGADEQQARYLVVQREVIRVGNLASKLSTELARLERLGVPLVTRQAKDEFMSRAQEEAGKAPTYRIVTTTGWDGLTFYFPDRVVPIKAARVEFYLDEGLKDVHRRYQRAGTHGRRGWWARGRHP